MSRVLGIGGVFFRSADPKGVLQWYEQVLGLVVQKWGGVKLQPQTRNAGVCRTESPGETPA